MEKSFSHSQPKPSHLRLWKRGSIFPLPQTKQTLWGYTNSLGIIFQSVVTLLHRKCFLIPLKSVCFQWILYRVDVNNHENNYSSTFSQICLYPIKYRLIFLLKAILYTYSLRLNFQYFFCLACNYHHSQYYLMLPKVF